MSTFLLLDACIAINLIATDRPNEISTALDIKFLMVRQAALECVGLQVTEGNLAVCCQQSSVDIASFADVLTLVESEIDAYIGLAREIDDGEAATIAVAQSRSLAMATDDRKARRVAVAAGVIMPIGTTTILRQYVDAAGLSAQETSVLLRRVRDEASYIPRRTDEHFDWWQQNVAP